MSKKTLRQKDDDGSYENRIGLVYVRVSSKRQEIEGSGLTSQEGRCIDELKRMEIPHFRTFPDSFSGGGDFMKRPAMREMLAYIDANPSKKFVVIFDDLKRFARDVEFHLKLRAAFRARNVILKCLNFNFENSPTGRFVEVIMAGGAELEREQNRIQVIQKQDARMKLGYWPFPSRKPYKMTKDPIHGNILKLQYPEADWLKEAMDGFDSRRFVRKIDACRFLVEKGYWTGQSPEKYIDKLTELFSDPLFAGYVECLSRGVERRIGHHEPLISLETFERIQKLMKNEGYGKRIRLDISEDFPLRGLTDCFHCGHPLTAAWSKGNGGKYPYYYCQNKKCIYKQKSILKEDIEKRFYKLLKKQTLKGKVGLILNKIFETEWADEIQDFKKGATNLKQHKNSLEVKIKQLSELATNTKSEAVRRAYETQMEAAVVEMEALEPDLFETLDLSIPYRTALDKATGLLKSPYKIWVTLDAREQHQLFYFIFEQKLPYDIKSGYRTEEIPTAVRLFEEFVASNSLDVELSTRCENRPIWRILSKLEYSMTHVNI